jgi:Tfp pilus assembly protein PilO
VKLRGKEIYIIAGVVAVVLAAAWYFLFLSPVRTKLTDASSQVIQARQSLQDKQAEVRKLVRYEKSAPQSKVDLVVLGKMLPSQGNVPSTIIELTQASKVSGLDFQGITPSAPQMGSPFGLQTIILKLHGTFFDAEDYLYRLENYVQYRNDDFVVTGRLVQPVNVQLTAQSSSIDPKGLNIAVTLNAYMWPATASTPAAAAATSGGTQ